MGAEKETARFCPVCSREIDRFFSYAVDDGPPRLGVRMSEAPELVHHELVVHLEAFDHDGMTELSGDVDGTRIFENGFHGMPGFKRWSAQLPATRGPLSGGSHVLTVNAVDATSHRTTVTVHWVYEP